VLIPAQLAPERLLAHHHDFRLCQQIPFARLRTATAMARVLYRLAGSELQAGSRSAGAAGIGRPALRGPAAPSRAVASLPEWLADRAAGGIPRLPNRRPSPLAREPSAMPGLDQQHLGFAELVQWSAGSVNHGPRSRRIEPPAGSLGVSFQPALAWEVALLELMAAGGASLADRQAPGSSQPVTVLM